MDRTTSSFALFALRFGLACVFLYHGGQKVFGWFGGSGIAPFAEDLARHGFPLPYLSALLASLAQLLGGLSLLLGWGTRYLLAPLTFTMIVASIVDAHSGFSNARGGCEFSFLCLCAVLAAWLLGPGEISVSKLIPAFKEVR